MSVFLGALWAAQAIHRRSSSVGSVHAWMAIITEAADDVVVGRFDASEPFLEGNCCPVLIWNFERKIGRDGSSHGTADDHRPIKPQGAIEREMKLDKESLGQAILLIPPFHRFWRLGFSMIWKIGRDDAVFCS